MNEKRNFDYKRLHPFKWYILENFPFLEDSLDVLTNYQLFCKLGEMYNKEIDAINTLGIQVEDITDWFDNLDVQEEVNKKLDEMAESGELAEIMAAYLNTRAVLGFNTINDLKDSEITEEGSFVRTYGRDSYDDGFGAFYKVRNRTFDDVPDDYNIIVLNDENLVAEKVNDYNTQEIEDFVLYAFFDDVNDDEIKLYVSKDNIHLEQIILPNKIYGRDPSIAYFNNKFYIAFTTYSEDHDFGIYESSDLINWTRHNIDVGLYDATYSNRWAPDLFVDGDKLYVIISKQYAASDTYNVYGKFKPYIVECTDIDSLTFGTPEELVLNNAPHDNYIDGGIIKIEDTYHLIIKCDNQQVLNLEDFTSTDLKNFTFVSSDFGQFGRFAEGQFAYKFKNQYVLGAERYYERDREKSFYRIKVSEDFENFSNYEQMYYYDIDLSHGSAFVITDKRAKKIISNKQDYGFRYDYNFENIKNKYIIASNTKNYDFPKGRYLKIMSIRQQIAYKIFSIQFKITELQGYRFDSLIELEGYTGSTATPVLNEQNVRQLSGKCVSNTNYKLANLHGKIIMIPNTTEKCYDVYMDLDDYSSMDMTVAIDIISANIYDADVKIYSEVFADTLPVSIGNINSAYRCKNLFSPFNNLYIDNGSNNKLTVKLCCPNTTFRLFGHGRYTTYASLYDYNIGIINGAIHEINRNTNLSDALTFTLDSYTDNIYTISITGLQVNGGFVISLPDILGASILDYSLSTV